MADLDEIYNTKLLELAAHIPCSERLNGPDATATAHSKLCGSTITIDLKMSGDSVSGFGQTVKACLLGQATAAIVGAHIIGATAAELRATATAMHAMLKENGEPRFGAFCGPRVAAARAPLQGAAWVRDAGRSTRSRRR